MQKKKKLTFRHAIGLAYMTYIQLDEVEITSSTVGRLAKSAMLYSLEGDEQHGTVVKESSS